MKGGRILLAALATLLTLVTLAASAQAGSTLTADAVRIDVKPRSGKLPKNCEDVLDRLLVRAIVGGALHADENKNGRG